MRIAFFYIFNFFNFFFFFARICRRRLGTHTMIQTSQASIDHSFFLSRALGSVEVGRAYVQVEYRSIELGIEAGAIGKRWELGSHGLLKIARSIKAE